MIPSILCMSCSVLVRIPRSNVMLSNPYVVFFQPSQRDLPLNSPIVSLLQTFPPSPTLHRSVQESESTNRERRLWRGNVLVAKYADVPFGEMISCGMNDLPIISRHFLYREPVGNDLDV